jgi:hypothetical protein
MIPYYCLGNETGQPCHAGLDPASSSSLDSGSRYASLRSSGMTTFIYHATGLEGKEVAASRLAEIVMKLVPII